MAVAEDPSSQVLMSSENDSALRLFVNPDGSKDSGMDLIVDDSPASVDSPKRMPFGKIDTLKPEPCQIKKSII